MDKTFHEKLELFESYIEENPARAQYKLSQSLNRLLKKYPSIRRQAL